MPWRVRALVGDKKRTCKVAHSTSVRGPVDCFELLIDIEKTSAQPVSGKQHLRFLHGIARSSGYCCTYNIPCGVVHYLAHLSCLSRVCGIRKKRSALYKAHSNGMSLLNAKRSRLRLFHLRITAELVFPECRSLYVPMRGRVLMSTVGDTSALYCLYRGSPS